MTFSNKSLALLVMSILAFNSCADTKAKEIFAKYGKLPKGNEISENMVIALVSVPDQRMLVNIGGKTNLSYKISTAAAGIGTKIGSNCTPSGWHRVHSRFGKKASIGQVFSSRRPVEGKVLTEKEWLDGSGDLVLSRIFWLEGIEEGKNCGKNIKSLERYFYIHGTNQEKLLGKPASHGCIRMANKDVVELFTLTSKYKRFYVNILENGWK